MASEVLLSNNLRAEMLDIDVLAAVNAALHNLDTVRESGLALRVSVLDEVVTVSGVVLSRIMRQGVLQTIWQVPGVRRVIDQLYTDTDLAAAVSQGLAADPLTQAMYHIKVTSYRGQVTLVGEVPDIDLVNAVVKVASNLPGVKTVVNRLVVSDSIE